MFLCMGYRSFRFNSELCKNRIKIQFRILFGSNSKLGSSSELWRKYLDLIPSMVGLALITNYFWTFSGICFGLSYASPCRPPGWLAGYEDSKNNIMDSKKEHHLNLCDSFFIPLFILSGYIFTCHRGHFLEPNYVPTYLITCLDW